MPAAQPKSARIWSGSGTAAHTRVSSDPAAFALQAWIARASIERPLPGGPQIKTGSSLRDASMARSMARWLAALAETMWSSRRRPARRDDAASIAALRCGSEIG